MNSYWFVYNQKSKRFLWLSRNSNDGNRMIITMTGKWSSENRRIVYLIDKGYKLKYEREPEPSWETYYDNEEIK